MHTLWQFNNWSDTATGRSGERDLSVAGPNSNLPKHCNLDFYPRPLQSLLTNGHIGL